MNSEGYWSNELSYYFSIRPPWWKTNWAYLIYTIILVIGIILVDRIQTYRVIKKERDKTRDRELEQAHEIEKANKKLQLQINIVEEQKVELEKQKLLSDNLLLNILPSEVAEELKEKGYSEVKYIEEATVLFADFIDFTKLSEKFSPKELVAEIHECYSTFDHIMNKYKVEKIKTVGDSYLAAGGLPLPFEDSALNTVKAGLEMQNYIRKRKERREKLGLLSFDMRIGIHTGPLVAGIVGVIKFQYDIWGDTVNTANRMETCGELGKVNISGTTYERVKENFVCKYRGKMTAKGKGEIDMYFVVK
jgi:class 3 adenylate cyclase